MKFNDYEKALSAPRIGKYCLACNGDKNKALILYRYNIKLCQKFYGLVGVLEVVLRNAIDNHYKQKLLDNDWLITQANMGFLVNKKDKILEGQNRLLKNGTYTHDKLISSLSFSIWTYMFSKNCYKNSNKTLLHIFQNKTHGFNQKNIYSDLDKVRNFRNRIAHYEPVCFDSFGKININYAQEIFELILKYLYLLGYNTNEILYGIESPSTTLLKIKELM